MSRTSEDRAKREFFERIAREYGPAIRLQILSTLEGSSDVEDITQEVMIRIWHSTSKFKGKSTFGTWIYSIVHNLCLSQISQKSLNRVSFEEPEGEEAYYVPDDQEGPLEELETGELETRLIECIKLLSPRESEIYTLYYIRKLGVPQIAMTLGISKNLVHAAMSRARKRLRRLSRRRGRRGNQQRPMGTNHEM